MSRFPKNIRVGMSLVEIEAKAPFRQIYQQRLHHAMRLRREQAIEVKYSTENIKRLRCQIPEGAWDSHMHVVDPQRYPLAANAQYTPAAHVLGQALAREAQLAIYNLVLVQPSIYGNDNSCLLDALRILGPHRARGVVVFDPADIDLGTMQSWHELGVRGVRLNFQSVGKAVNTQELDHVLHQYADLIRPFGWVLQLYLPLSALETLEEIIPRLRVKVCFDHFGNPSMTDQPPKEQDDPYQIAGFSSLTRLLQQGNTYVKISAPYRLIEDNRQLEKMTKTLLSIAGGRQVVFGTDWPHTRYTGLDITPFVQMVVDWCNTDKNLENLIFRDNAVRLWSGCTES